jgi:S-formylglutathione hydrolase FrmB
MVDAKRDSITFHNPMFDPAFGRPRDTAFAALNNGANLVCNATAPAMQSITWFVQYGPREAEPGDSNFFRGEHLLEKLAEKGVSNGVDPVLRGGHNWKTADEHMRQTFPLHWRVLGATR